MSDFKQLCAAGCGAAAAIMILVMAADPAEAVRLPRENVQCVSKVASEEGPLTAGVEVVGISYTVTVSSTAETGHPVTVRDTLPDDAVFISASPPANCADQGGGVVECTFDPLPAGTTDVTIVIDVPNPASDLVNVAQVIADPSDNTKTNDDGGAGSSCQNTIPVAPAPQVTMACTGKLASIESFVEGNLPNFNYEISFLATGDVGGLIQGITLNDPLPSEVDFVSANVTEGPGNCNEAGGTVSCTFDDITVNVNGALNDRTVVIGVQANNTAQAGDVISNTATVASTDPVTETTCSDTVVVEQGEQPEGCRMTGGGVDQNGDTYTETGDWNGLFGDDKFNNGVSGEDRYQFGGQAGANTGSQPQPKGEWTHHQQRGPSGRFTFHGGTASAPIGTEIDFITCSDPENCNPARPAPFKQLDFVGVGSFKSLRSTQQFPPPGETIRLDSTGNPTLHCFEVNVDDMGEPGKSGQFSEPDPNMCPPDGFGRNGSEEFGSCSCPDFYRIKIYSADASLGEGECVGDVIYEVYGYIDGGNIQLHPPTGFDLQTSN